ncbi:hypothetical protein [Ktedonospora formicarum]|uniref:Uncharacterized protein n=1 Tax=Ktedonospora formicarum TaxID=2778364 RepID=A0A8J3MX17_9CHLR|nr:hypothetical protein [Ktedonospora formicarum]GHO48125.1 hypothetical protein KSX_62880 [Ktedonospora formicarum]
MEALQEALVAAMKATKDVRASLEDGDKTYSLLRASELRLLGYCLMFDAIFLITYDALTVAYRKRTGKAVHSGMGVRKDDTIVDFAGGLAFLKKYAAPEPDPGLPTEVRERLEANRELFVEATNVLKWVYKQLRSPAWEIYHRASKFFEGLDDHWLEPYGAPSHEMCDAA